MVTGFMDAFPISNSQAQQKINAFIGAFISDIMISGSPELIERSDGQYIWRGSLFLTYKSAGWIGPVGVLDVDAISGEVLYTEKMLEELRSEAGRIATKVFLNRRDE